MFIFSLAKELHMTVNELSSTMSASELQEWIAFFKLKDEKYLDEINLKIAETTDDNLVKLRAFLMNIKGNKKK